LNKELEDSTATCLECEHEWKFISCLGFPRECPVCDSDRIFTITSLTTTLSDIIEERDDHYLERCALDSAIDDLIFTLEEEIEARGIQPTLVEYHCPYCDFTSEFFYVVTIHIACTLSCSEKSEKQPCYPIQKVKKKEALDDTL
jgi:hypothetical protein